MIILLEVYIDGASAGNPGPSAIGVFIKGEGHQVRIGEYIGLTNNHIAEFKALIRGLEEAKKLGTTTVSVRSDSKIAHKTRRDIKKTAKYLITTTPGTHDVKVTKDGKEVYSKKVVISTSETKIIEL